MKLMITWLRKNRICRTWTNAESHEHAAMALAVYANAMKRLSKDWNCSVDEVAKKINDAIETAWHEIEGANR